MSSRCFWSGFGEGSKKGGFAGSRGGVAGGLVGGKELGGHEGGTFDEAAEFFFGDVMNGAFFGSGIGHFFVLDGEAGPFDDSEVVVSLLPDLALFEFEFGLCVHGNR